MRYPSNSVVCRGLAIAVAILSLASTARANVYATNLKLNGSTNDASIQPGQGLSISYILNEAASGGVTIRILSGTTAVKTISIASGNPGTLRGTNTVSWNGATDGGTNPAGGVYAFSITPAAAGQLTWWQTTSDTNAGNQAWLPWGLAVNQNTNSFYYGRVFVANSFQGPNPDTNTADRLGFQKLNADASPAEEGIFSSGGYPWSGNSSPFRVRVGADDRFYAQDGSIVGGVVMSWDQAITTNSILYVSRDDNDPLGANFPGYYVSGTGTNRQMWMADGDSGGVGVNVWNVQTNGVLATNDLGTSAVPVSPANGLEDSAYDVAVDAAGRIYVVCEPPSSSQYKVMRFPAYTGSPLTNADWRVDNTSTMFADFAIAVNPAASYVAVARAIPGDVLILDAATGLTVTNISANGNAHHAVAWDNVGNLYTTYDAPGDSESAWQAWSPPGTNAATTVGLEKIQVVSPPKITSIVPSGTNFVITFTGSASDAPSAYSVMSGAAVTGITNVVASATIIGSGGVFQATVPANGAIQFYRVRR